MIVADDARSRAGRMRSIVIGENIPVGESIIGANIVGISVEIDFI